MFFVDHPYISDYFRKTVRDHAIPVVATPAATKMGLYPGTPILSEEDACQRALGNAHPQVYTTSENALGWLALHEEFRGLTEKAGMFKNKLAFRELGRPHFPDFFFTEVRTEDLRTFPFHTVPLPCVIKPAVGFFSMGVHTVTQESQWPEIVSAILGEIEEVRNLYPSEVLDPGSFIVEQCIAGEEFAVDAYYGPTGEPIVVGIMKHSFSSDQDVRDRVYTTSKAIIEQNLEEFTAFAGDIGRLAGVKNFPVHIEIRRQGSGKLLPIEVNPLRFGGWCSTAEINPLAYGLNPYVAYYRQERPDWAELVRGREGKLFSIVVLDNSTGFEAHEIRSFDYDRMLATFEKPLELRAIDFTAYPVFGFLFTETSEDNQQELLTILNSDLREFVVPW